MYNGIDVPSLKYISRMRERGDFIVIDNRDGISTYQFDEFEEKELLAMLKDNESENAQEIFERFCTINTPSTCNTSSQID